jgi:hypothetical protein
MRTHNGSNFEILFLFLGQFGCSDKHDQHSVICVSNSAGITSFFKELKTIKIEIKEQFQNFQLIQTSFQNHSMFCSDYPIPSCRQIEEVKQKLYGYIVSEEIIPDSVRLGNISVKIVCTIVKISFVQLK